MKMRLCGHILKVVAVVVICLIEPGNACAGRGKKGGNGKQPPPKNNPDNGNKQPPSNPSAAKDLVGPINTSPYDDSGYGAKNGQANSPDDLKCDFESQCCWKNAKPPYDTMEFYKASGTPDPQKLQQNFGTSTAPTGNWLMIAADTPAGPDDKAEFDSCTIPCAGDQIQVTLKHWVTQGVKLQVCEVSQSDPTQLIGCQDVPSTSPGPDTVQLPPGQNIFIAIIASNFVASGGSVAMIDDITVAYPPCSSTPGSTPPQAGTTVSAAAPPPSTDELKKICCDFSAGGCNWNRGSGPSSPPGKVNDFQNAGPTYFHNPATGVVPSPDKKFYGCYMMQNEACYMESAANINQPITIKFQEYKLTQDLDLKACCNSDQGCTYETGGKTEKGDFRQWYAGAIQCPAGTTKVVFSAANTGKNEGGVGIDNVQVFDANGQQIC